MTAWYNENDPYCAEWLENLISAGVLAPGVVDRRSIEDVLPSDLVGYTQHHFFAGIGVWSYALRCAGWPDDRPVWTGSCPCQPFSEAGKGTGFADERHLWPAWYHLARVFGPISIFGEQVANGDGLAWLDLVSSDVEGAGYTIRAADTCAAGYGAPEIRQRLYFNAVADPDYAEWRAEATARDNRNGAPARWLKGDCDSRERSAFGWLADADESRREHELGGAGRCSSLRAEAIGPVPSVQQLGANGSSLHNEFATAVRGFWRDVDWLVCRDDGGRTMRPVECGTFPLVAGASGRMGRLRAYGNALNAEQAIGFVEACLAEDAEEFGE